MLLFYVHISNYSTLNTRKHGCFIFSIQFYRYKLCQKPFKSMCLHILCSLKSNHLAWNQLALGRAIMADNSLEFVIVAHMPLLVLNLIVLPKVNFSFFFWEEFIEYSYVMAFSLLRWLNCKFIVGTVIKSPIYVVALVPCDTCHTLELNPRAW